MNKAFMKEQEQGSDGHCPRCGSLGTAVGERTLRAFLPEKTLESISKSAYFCPFQRCSVVYFDTFDRVVEEDALVKPVYPKDLDAPICGCFGFTCDEIDQDVREGGLARVRALIDKARSPEAKCAMLAADGQSCIQAVQTYYMRQRAKAEDQA